MKYLRSAYGFATAAVLLEPSVAALHLILPGLWPMYSYKQYTPTPVAHPTAYRTSSGGKLTLLRIRSRICKSVDASSMTFVVRRRAFNDLIGHGR